MKKKILAVVLTFVMVMTMVMPTFAAGETEWTLDCFNIEGTTVTGLTETGLGLIESNPNVVIPATNADGEAITAISASAFDAGTIPASFNECSKITGVTIPDTVTTIGNFAFRNCSLKEVVLPDSVTTLGTGAFLHGVAGTIEKVTLSKNLTEIPASAFSGGNGGVLTEVVIPEGVTSIGSRAFAACPITTLSLPSTVTTIGSYAFAQHQLTEVVIPDAVTKIDSYAFTQHQTGVEATLTTVTFGSGLLEIGGNAFRACAITEVTIPEGLTTLNKNAFNGCPEVVKVYTTNEDHATSLAASTYHEIVVINSWTTDCFTYDGTTVTGFSELGKMYFAKNTEVVIPATNPDGEAITAIGANAFAAQPMTAITFPETLVEIGSAAFRATSLTKVVLPDSVTTLGNGAFTNVPTLTEVTLSKGLTEIAQSAFNYTGIKELVIPEGVTTIGRMAFRNTPITSLTLPSTLVTIDKQAFDGNQLTELVIPDSVTDIGQSAFSQNVKGEGLAPSLTKLTLGTGVKTIGKQAFEKSVLTEVTIPEGLETLDTNAFKDGTQGVVKVYTTNYEHFTSLAESTYHELSYIGEWGEDCFVVDGTTITGLSEKGKAVAENNKEMTIPSTINGVDVTAIGENAFENLGLTKATLPEKLETIGKAAFAGNKLTTVDVPDTMKEIAADAFSGNGEDVQLVVYADEAYDNLKDVDYTGAVLVDKTPADDTNTDNDTDVDNDNNTDNNGSINKDNNSGNNKTDSNSNNTGSSKAVKTGDTNPILPFGILAMVSLGAIVAVVSKKRSL